MSLLQIMVVRTVSSWKERKGSQSRTCGQPPARVPQASGHHVRLPPALASQPQAGPTDFRNRVSRRPDVLVSRAQRPSPLRVPLCLSWRQQVVNAACS